jgi:hypothetical protein
MILMAAVTINSNGDGDRGYNGNGRNGRNGDNGDGSSRNSDNGDGSSRNSDNGDGSSRNSVDWEVEWIMGMDSEQTMSVAVELGKGVTAEDI